MTEKDCLNYSDIFHTPFHTGMLRKHFPFLRRKANVDKSYCGVCNLLCTGLDGGARKANVGAVAGCTLPF